MRAPVRPGQEVIRFAQGTATPYGVATDQPTLVHTECSPALPTEREIDE